MMRRGAGAAASPPVRDGPGADRAGPVEQPPQLPRFGFPFSSDCGIGKQVAVVE